MKINQLKTKITEYKEKLKLLSLLLERINLNNESRISDNLHGLINVTNEIELNEIWKKRENSSFSNDYSLTLGNLDKYYKQVRDLMIDANYEEKIELERLNNELDLLSTNRYCLLKINNNLHQRKFSILDLLIEAREIEKVYDVLINGSEVAVLSAIEALIDGYSYGFYLILDNLNIKFSELNLPREERERIIARIKKIFKKRDFINDKDSYLYFILGNRTEEDKYNIIRGINLLDNEFLTKFIYEDKNNKPYLTSSIVVQSGQLLLGGKLFEEEMKNFKGSIPEVGINTRKKIFSYLLDNYKSSLAGYLNTIEHFNCDIDDLKTFLQKVPYVSSEIDVYILGKILFDVEIPDATLILEQHNELYDIKKIKEQRALVIDHLKALSEHLLDTAPARSLVKDNTPANIQYTKK